MASAVILAPLALGCHEGASTTDAYENVEFDAKGGNKRCGNGVCDRNEACSSCPVDCGACGECTPATCSSLGKDCGTVADGCASILDCGSCTAPETCGGGGVANVCGGGSGALYYVATNGDDANPGTDALPFRTILGAYAHANAGDTIVVKPGTYSETYNDYGLRLDRSGTATAPITLRSQVRWQAVLDGQNDSAHGEVLWFSGAFNVVEGFEVTRGYAGGVAVYGNDNTLVGNHIHHNGNGGDPASSYGQDGVYSDSQTHGNAYVANYIHDNGRIAYESNLDHGLYLCGDDELVANNIVTSNSAYGLQIAGYDTVSNMRVYNNVIAYNGRSAIVIWQTMSGVAIKNNAFYENAHDGIGIYHAYGSGVTIDHNVFFGNDSGTIAYVESNLGYDSSGVFTFDPAFVNPTAGEFHLSVGSPAIDAGVSLSEVPTDFGGLARPQGAGYDLGAYER
jgi:hypothetical protein